MKTVRDYGCGALCIDIANPEQKCGEDDFLCPDCVITLVNKVNGYEDTVIIDKDTVLNVLSWDWNQLKEEPDSIDWIPALRALEKLEKIANKQLFGGKDEV